ncbi:unnamed protein product [Meloidogyne enterolobii]|uniref:Uncharacterized protein n=1 Tax=Meloidogyne enterolobii TaxID=390850 RepID=A0ACB1B3K9_MELEN
MFLFHQKASGIFSFPKSIFLLLYFLFFHCCPFSSFFLFLLSTNHPFQYKNSGKRNLPVARKNFLFTWLRIYSSPAHFLINNRKNIYLILTSASSL